MLKHVFCFFVISGLVMANALALDPIRVLTTQSVANRVNVIANGAATDVVTQASVGAQSYRRGYVPQDNRLTATKGTVVGNSEISAAISNVSVGDLAVTTNDVATPTVYANKVNIAVLERDKLVKPGNGGTCNSNSDACAYVTTNTHSNTGTDKVWFKIIR